MNNFSKKFSIALNLGEWILFEKSCSPFKKESKKSTKLFGEQSYVS